MFKIQIVAFSAVLAHNKYSPPLWETATDSWPDRTAWELGVTEKCGKKESKGCAEMICHSKSPHAYAQSHVCL